MLKPDMVTNFSEKNSHVHFFFLLLLLLLFTFLDLLKKMLSLELLKSKGNLTFILKWFFALSNIQHSTVYQTRRHNLHFKTKRNRSITTLNPKGFRYSTLYFNSYYKRIYHSWIFPIYCPLKVFFFFFMMKQLLLKQVTFVVPYFFFLNLLLFEDKNVLIAQIVQNFTLNAA